MELDPNDFTFEFAGDHDTAMFVYHKRSNKLVMTAKVTMKEVRYSVEGVSPRSVKRAFQQKFDWEGQADWNRLAPSTLRMLALAMCACGEPGPVCDACKADHVARLQAIVASLKP